MYLEPEKRPAGAFWMEASSRRRLLDHPGLAAGGERAPPGGLPEEPLLLFGHSQCYYLVVGVLYKMEKLKYVYH